MNASTQFILDSIKKWEKKFPGIHIRYAFEEDTCFHVIEVEPEEIHVENDDFAYEESKLWDEFFEKFPDEDILISSPSICNDMSHLIHETGAIVESFSDTVFESNKISTYPFIKFDNLDIDSFISNLNAQNLSGRKYNYLYNVENSYCWENEYALAA